MNLRLIFNLPNVSSNAAHNTQKSRMQSNIKLLRDQTLLEVREDSQSTESLYEACEEAQGHISLLDIAQKNLPLPLSLGVYLQREYANKYDTCIAKLAIVSIHSLPS